MADGVLVDSDAVRRQHRAHVQVLPAPVALLADVAVPAGQVGRDEILHHILAARPGVPGGRVKLQLEQFVATFHILQNLVLLEWAEPSLSDIHLAVLTWTNSSMLSQRASCS